MEEVIETINKKSVVDYVKAVNAFHKHLQTNFEIKEKQPLCKETKMPHKGEDWTLDNCFYGWRCKICDVTWLENRISPPKSKNYFPDLEI